MEYCLLKYKNKGGKEMEIRTDVLDKGNMPVEQDEIPADELVVEDSEAKMNSDIDNENADKNSELEANNGDPISEESCPDLRLRLEDIERQVKEQADSYKKLAVDVREMHKLYHNEFAGRLKSMQDELERYHEIDRGRAFDDVLREVARIYCDNETLLGAEVDEKTAKHIRYLFMDIKQLLESNGVMLQKSESGDKRNNKFCQIVERVETNDPKLHDTVVSSKGTGFYTEKRPLIKELVDVYIYKEAVAASTTE